MKHTHDLDKESNLAACIRMIDAVRNAQDFISIPDAQDYSFGNGDFTMYIPQFSQSPGR